MIGNIQSLASSSMPTPANRQETAHSCSGPTRAFFLATVLHSASYAGPTSASHSDHLAFNGPIISYCPSMMSIQWPIQDGWVVWQLSFKLWAAANLLVLTLHSFYWPMRTDGECNLIGIWAHAKLSHDHTCQQASLKLIIGKSPFKLRGY